jgi:hypothetical protein
MMAGTYHVLKKRMKDASTCSQARRPPLGGWSGAFWEGILETSFIAAVESLAVVGDVDMFAELLRASA